MASVRPVTAYRGFSLGQNSRDVDRCRSPRTVTTATRQAIAPRLNRRIFHSGGG
ncbi:hypothetical protein JJD41_24355 [Oxynema sp. CENA135]|uniref:hypothetical protein n=1 Tax=Oxynema sp. CENA135 TaxID=984206 RepID=UPI00190AD43F|nr:hypothetical protein [Oxynema sp. CENA135]MBK4732973.1 hypothetical protein [Oxynema sp. CENA135]